MTPALRHAAAPEQRAPSPSRRLAARRCPPRQRRSLRSRASSAAASSAAPAAFPHQPPRGGAGAGECVIDPHPHHRLRPRRPRRREGREGLSRREGLRQPRASARRQGNSRPRRSLDLLAVQPGRRIGRITVADVERALAEKPKPMSKMRQIIAQRLTQACVTAPHFYVTVEVDMTDAARLSRRSSRAAARPTPSPTSSRRRGAGVEGIPDGEQRDRRQDHPLEQPRASRHRGVAWSRAWSCR